MSSGDARGRSFHAGRVETAPDAVNYGHNFQEQWQRVWELQPPFVMVTGWNEWIAGRWGKLDGPLTFVDQFNQECSRDIEPAKVGHKDNYYWQLAANVRRYKGASPLPQASGPLTIRIPGSFEQWKGVVPEYADHVGETEARDYDGAAGLHYREHSGRNDLQAVKVARDRNNVYFYARTMDALSPRKGKNWMWLLLDVDQNPRTGWEGYDFVVNRSVDPHGASWLEANMGGWTWKRVAPVKLQVTGRDLQLAIPKKLLGLPAGARPLGFDFKWADHLQAPGNVMDFYLSGDVAPEGRYNYRYSAR